ncbi:MAG: hypothetical protein ACQEXJ_06225 [Myxococcota bacterium]
MAPMLETVVGVLATLVWFAPTVGLAASVIRSTRRHAAMVVEEPARLTEPRAAMR